LEAWGCWRITKRWSRRQLNPSIRTIRSSGRRCVSTL
jgi:hypothetical protein